MKNVSKNWNMMVNRSMLFVYSVMILLPTLTHAQIETVKSCKNQLEVQFLGKGFVGAITYQRLLSESANKQLNFASGLRLPVSVIFTDKIAIGFDVRMTQNLLKRKKMYYSIEIGYDINGCDIPMYSTDKYFIAEGDTSPYGNLLYFAPEFGFNIQRFCIGVNTSFYHMKNRSNYPQNFHNGVNLVGINLQFKF